MALAPNFASSSQATLSISIVGCGPGSLDYLTPAARRSIEEAEVLVGAWRLLALFPGSGAKRIVVGSDIPQALDQLASQLGQQKVAVLVSGDPGVCSLAQPVIRRFGWQSCRVIPGVSSVQVAFARVGVDWTDARLISAHHHVPDTGFASLVSEPKIALLAGNSSNMSWVIELAEHLAETHTIFACQDLTLPQEQVFCLSPEQLAACPLSSQTILLFLGKKLRP
jgi:precorrin-6y C5,15-methyltransferase (decarboxylating) CbiE subunit